MKIIIHENNNVKAAEIVSDNVIINKLRDALDLMVNMDYLGSRRIILHEKNIDPSFFYLHNGLAGMILLKYINYKIKLAIVGDFSKYYSKNLTSFIADCNKGEHFFFSNNIETAKIKLLEQPS